jgi:UDP-N-acetylglucosamine 1-carboxyvinyltransferase
MDKFVMNGGNRLKGSLTVSGSKNSALPILAATLLSEGQTVLRNVPDIADITTMIELLRGLGCDVRREGPDVYVEVRGEGNSHAEYDRVRKMRASVSVLGPLLAKRKEARVAKPGGCVIGIRPVDLHIRGLETLGAEITLDDGDMIAKAPRLRGTTVFMGGPFGSTVLGTDTVMSAATLAEGTTVIECAACEPEVEDLANFLNKMGAKITGAGTPRITIQGVEKLTGCEYAIIPDRIEAGTFMVAAAITNGEVALHNVRLNHMVAVTDRLRAIGVNVEQKNGAVLVSSSRHLEPTDVTTLPYPGFPTDMQAQLMCLLCLADGNSAVTEKIYPDRFMHVAELGRMGCQIRKEGSTAIIQGVKKLTGARVTASDLRASAALVIAGLVAKGQTTISRVYHIDRGYENIVPKLQSLGADIQRVSDKEKEKDNENE